MKLTEETYDALMARVNEGILGEDSSFACNAIDVDHLHVRRLGAEKDGFDGRVSVFVHSFTGGVVSLFFDHQEARQIAAALLNAADELDDVAPLTFFPPDPTSEG